MKSWIAFISIVLNLVLLGAILLILRKPAPKFVGQMPREIAHARILQVIETVTQTNFVPQSSVAPFDWSQVESEDFVVYANNLRGIGCPEETVRDILTAEINDLFVHRRQDLFRPLQSQFWDLMAQGGGDDLLSKEIRDKAEALDEEKEILLKKVLPTAGPKEENFYQGVYASLLDDFLPPEKLQQLGDISKNFLELQGKIQTNDLPGVEKQKQIALLNEQSSTDQKGILSAEELEEFNLRNSPVAQQRGNLLGFNASEEELRAMARLASNEKPAPRDQKAPDYGVKSAEYRAAQEKVGKQMKALLGDKRFEEYERSKDSSFQNLRKLARRYDLSSQTMLEVYEMARSTSKDVSAFKKTNLDSDERDAALETIRQQTARAMIAKLGVRAAETYRRNFNNWDEIPDSK